MKIIGIGTDVIEVDRIEKAIQDENFVKRFLTEKEIFALKDSDAKRYAGRFACKESVVKALGTGFGSEITALDFEITNSISGKPVVTFLKEEYKDMKAMVSISHIDSVATANAICYMED